MNFFLKEIFNLVYFFDIIKWEKKADLKKR